MPGVRNLLLAALDIDRRINRRAADRHGFWCQSKLGKIEDSHFGLLLLTVKPIDPATEFRISATCSALSTMFSGPDPGRYSAPTCRNSCVSGNSGLAIMMDAVKFASRFVQENVACEGTL